MCYYVILIEAVFSPIVVKFTAGKTQSLGCDYRTAEPKQIQEQCCDVSENKLKSVVRFPAAECETGK